MATVYDLSRDPVACAVLRHLARQPWHEAHWLALRDRAEEMGLDPQRSRRGAAELA